jgi:cold shock CspA family protein
MTGTVSNIIAAKKFGFISGDNGQEYFFHREETLSNWDELVSDFSQAGAGKIKVTFEPVKTPKGPRAKDVTVFEAE